MTINNSIQDILRAAHYSINPCNDSYRLAPSGQEAFKKYLKTLAQNTLDVFSIVDADYLRQANQRLYLDRAECSLEYPYPDPDHKSIDTHLTARALSELPIYERSNTDPSSTCFIIPYGFSMSTLAGTIVIGSPAAALSALCPDRTVYDLLQKAVFILPDTTLQKTSAPRSPISIVTNASVYSGSSLLMVTYNCYFVMGMTGVQQCTP